MSSSTIQAIDVHCHYGVYGNSESVLKNTLLTADIQTVLHRARQANTRLSFITPIEAFFMEGDGDVTPMNEATARLVNETEGVRQWVVVNPLCPKSYTQAAEILKTPGCIGIKIHPAMHRYRITDYAMQLVEFAAEHHAVLQSHSGEEGCLPEDYVAAADAFPEVPIIMSHLGCGYDGDPGHHVRAIQRSKHGNLYTDTSSANSIMANLIEWAVREVGAAHILFGTDSPLYFAAMQRARIDYADISEADKRLILCENAIRLFRLPVEAIATH